MSLRVQFVRANSIKGQQKDATPLLEDSVNKHLRDKINAA